MRVVIYDTEPGFGVGNILLSWSWAVGAHLQKLFGFADAVYGAKSWEEATAWLRLHPTKHFDSIQFWGHGAPGVMYIGGMPAQRDTFNFLLGRVSGGLIWFRACSVFQGHMGHLFSERLANTLGCIVAGHTRIIGLFQGGLHTRAPHTAACWPKTEGELPKSWIPPYLRWGPRSIFCLTTRIPAGW